MLLFKPTPKNAGIELWGDSWMLTSIQEFIGRVVDGNPLIEDAETFLLGLSYDVRKAASGQRKRGIWEQAPHAGNITIFGVEVLWPTIIVQLGLLRRAMAFMASSREDQSIMFSLEAALETVLKQVDPRGADKLMNLVSVVGAHPYEHLARTLESRCRYFAEQKPEMRISVLPMLMASFDPLYAHFTRSYSGEPGNGVIPAEVWAHYEDDETQWPEVDW